MEWYLKVVRDNYFNFDGRAHRKEFWMFALVHIIISIGLGILEEVIGLFAILYLLYAVAVILPTLGVSVRRLHDIDKSGWWILMGFIPVLGFFVLLYFYVKEGTKGSNKFGDDPHGGASVAPTPSSEESTPEAPKEGE